MLTLYPGIKPYATHQIKIDELHTIYMEECGTPRGIPVVFLHGGPGHGCGADDRRFFNPEAYRIILFDQRGSGRSTPHASLEHNTTEHLIEDLEAIRKYCEIEQWIIFGVGWGTTLGILYAQRYPKQVISMVLQSIFLGRKQDIDWAYQSGAKKFFPEHWKSFIAPLPAKKQNNIVQSYLDIFLGKDEVAKMGAAKAWSKWESTCSTFEPQYYNSHTAQLTAPHLALGLSKLAAYYFSSKLFIEDGAILKNIDKLSKIPGLIVHGRYNMLSTIDNAFLLQESWVGSELEVLANSGHYTFEPPIIHALVKAMNYLVK